MHIVDKQEEILSISSGATTFLEPLAVTQVMLDECLWYIVFGKKTLFITNYNKSE